MKNTVLICLLSCMFACVEEKKAGPLSDAKVYQFDDSRSNASVLLTSDMAVSIGNGSNGSFYSIKKRGTTAVIDTSSSFLLSDISTVSGSSFMVLKSAPNLSKTKFYPSNLDYYTITANQVIYFSPPFWNDMATISGLGNTLYFKDDKGNIGICVVRSYNIVPSKNGGSTNNVGFEINVVKY